MKIAIIGYGAMGKLIEKLAKEQGIEVVAIVDLTDSGATATAVSSVTLKDADVCIDFSSAGSEIENITAAMKAGKKMVVGTTGWYENISDAKKLVEEHNGSLIYAPNFSIGVNIFFKLVKDACKCYNAFPDYDPYVYELHHTRKADSPSGTAKQVGKIIVENLDRKNVMVFDKLDRKIKPEELHVASIRAGVFPGTHVVGFDSVFDNFEMKHTAKDRSGFASGAIEAAKWLMRKKGFFSVEDFTADLMSR